MSRLNLVKQKVPLVSFETYNQPQRGSKDNQKKEKKKRRDAITFLTGGGDPHYSPKRHSAINPIPSADVENAGAISTACLCIKQFSNHPIPRGRTFGPTVLPYSFCPTVRRYTLNSLVRSRA